jgi:hypothetical protein
MIKVRFTTWYWGNYALATKAECANLPQGFELYDEQKHGWYNSEEAKRGKKQYKTEHEDLFSAVYNSSYVTNYFKNQRN